MDNTTSETLDKLLYYNNYAFIKNRKNGINECSDANEYLEKSIFKSFIVDTNSIGDTMKLFGNDKYSGNVLELETLMDNPNLYNYSHFSRMKFDIIDVACRFYPDFSNAYSEFLFDLRNEISKYRDTQSSQISNAKTSIRKLITIMITSRSNYDIAMITKSELEEYCNFIYEEGSRETTLRYWKKFINSYKKFVDVKYNMKYLQNSYEYGSLVSEFELKQLQYYWIVNSNLYRNLVFMRKTDLLLKLDSPVINVLNSKSSLLLELELKTGNRDKDSLLKLIQSNFNEHCDSVKTLINENFNPFKGLTTKTENENPRKLIPSELLSKLISKYEVDFKDSQNDDGSPNPRYYKNALNPIEYNRYIETILFNLLLFLGIRTGELLQMRLKDYNPERKELKIYVEKRGKHFVIRKLNTYLNNILGLHVKNVIESNKYYDSTVNKDLYYMIPGISEGVGSSIIHTERLDIRKPATYSYVYRLTKYNLFENMDNKVSYSMHDFRATHITGIINYFFYSAYKNDGYIKGIVEANFSNELLSLISDSVKEVELEGLDKKNIFHLDGLDNNFILNSFTYYDRKDRPLSHVNYIIKSIMKYTGHKDELTFKGYYKKSDHKIALEIDFNHKPYDTRFKII